MPIEGANVLAKAAPTMAISVTGSANVTNMLPLSCRRSLISFRVNVRILFILISKVFSGDVQECFFEVRAFHFKGKNLFRSMDADDLLDGFACFNPGFATFRFDRKNTL